MSKKATSYANNFAGVKPNPVSVPVASPYPNISPPRVMKEEEYLTPQQQIGRQILKKWFGR
jgi:hypothetical protein